MCDWRFIISIHVFIKFSGSSHEQRWKFYSAELLEGVRDFRLDEGWAIGRLYRWNAVIRVPSKTISVNWHYSICMGSLDRVTGYPGWEFKRHYI